ncbi:MAG: hypothetical protein ACYT04_58975 [Nostoc sp.]
MRTRIFLANPDIDVNIPSYIEAALDDIKNEGEYYITWSAGNVKSIQVGDKAYLKKTGRGKRGFIAAGYVIKTEPAEHRLNELPQYHNDNYSHAYTQHFFGNCPTVSIRLDEVVSLDSPLEDSYLLQLSSMQGVNLVKYASGQKLGSQYEAALDAEWKKYFKKVNKLD